MSNISPQLPVFNRGIWKSLEKLVRDWGEKERIYVVTGPVFKDNKGKIGRTGVTVPGFFYKVVYAPGARQMIAFVLPHTKEKRQLRDYVVTVDSVERLTNIDFFSQLPDTLENRLEAAVDCIYVDEADMLNVAMFGMTAPMWCEQHPELKRNIRDYIP